MIGTRSNLEKRAKASQLLGAVAEVWRLETVTGLYALRRSESDRRRAIAMMRKDTAKNRIPLHPISTAAAHGGDPGVPGLERLDGQSSAPDDL